MGIDNQESEEEIQHNATRKKAMLLALEDSYGVVTPAAKAIGLDRCTHYRWYSNDPAYKLAVDDLKNVAIDHSESKLHELISGVTVEGGIDLETGETIVYKKEPNVTAVIFHLKTIGKNRGYREGDSDSNAPPRLPPTIEIVRYDDGQNTDSVHEKST